MADLLFKIDAQSGLLLHPEVIPLTEHLKKLDRKAIVFIVLAYDYESPYKQFPEQERIKKAKLRIYGSTVVNFDNEKLVEAGIEEYRSLQYNVYHEAIRTYTQKIENINILIGNEIDPNKLQNYMNAQDKLEERIDKTWERLNKSEEEMRMKGDAKLSLIEKWQLNRAAFLKDKQRQQVVADLDGEIKIE
jgi:hypothetical protein